MFLKFSSFLLTLVLPFWAFQVVSAESNNTTGGEEPNCRFGLTGNDISARSGLDLTGKVALVTGGRSGLGYAIAEALLLRNCTVVIASRKKDRNQMAVEDLKTTVLAGQVSYMTFDLEDFESVKSFASSFVSNYSRLDYYFGNAGQSEPEMMPLTVDGFERVFQVNYVAQFLLVQLLLPLLRSTTPSSRILLTGSITHQSACGALGLGPMDAEPVCFHESLPSNESAFSRIPFDQNGLDTMAAMGGYSCPGFSLGSYPVTKYLMVQLAQEIASREAAAGHSVYAYSWAPGPVRTALWPYATCCGGPIDIPGRCGGVIPYVGPTDALGNPNPPPYQVPNFWSSVMHGIMAPVYAALQANPSEAGSFFATYWQCAANNTVGYRNQGITKEGRARLYDLSMEWAGLNNTNKEETASETMIAAGKKGHIRGRV